MSALFAVPHIGFIVAAYGVTALVLAVMVAAVLLDGRAQARLLARLDAKTARKGTGS
jgi:heme exporter protein CcmD